VLDMVRANRDTATIPVIMLTTTDDPREIERCYAAGCSLYVSKPVEYDRFVAVITRLGEFLQTVSVPTNQPAFPQPRSNETAP
jgi:CheY-like chemotaxis protein